MFPHAVSARYDRAHGLVVVDLSSKLSISFSPRDAQGLENAKASELEIIELSPSGFGLHFPKLDADLYVPGLLEGLMGSRKWMAARLGAAGGQSRSRAKKRASTAGDFGISAKIQVAFGVVTSLTVVAATTAILSFSAIEEVLQQFVGQRVPVMTGTSKFRAR